MADSTGRSLSTREIDEYVQYIESTEDKVYKNSKAEDVDRPVLG